MQSGKNIDQDTNRVWELLQTIPDPEIPVLSITDLGIVRKVEFAEEKLLITITPTYSGCPAMNVFEDDIVSALTKAGYTVEMNTVYDPAWTTDWMNDDAKEKLRKYGIAPPVSGTADKGALFAAGPKVVACPLCKSENTTVVSQFGSTACKALYKCDECLEPFEYFKCI